MSFAVPNFKTAAAYGLRSMLKCRVSSPVFPSPIFTASGDGHYGTTHFIVDALLHAWGWPRIYTSSHLRMIVDGYIGIMASSPDPSGAHHVPGDIPPNGVPTYDEAIYGATSGEGRPMLDTAGSLALHFALCYDRGDSSVYSAPVPGSSGYSYAQRVKDSLDSTPRDSNGAIWNPDTLHRVTWCKEDGPKFGQGACVMPTVWHAWGYRELGRIAAAEGDSSLASACATAKASLVAGLAQLRYAAGDPSGFGGLYAASTNTVSAGGQDPTNGDHKPHIVGTSLAVVLDLCGSSANRTVTANALLTQYVAGKASRYGAARWMLGPFVWNAWRYGLDYATFNDLLVGANFGMFSAWLAEALTYADATVGGYTGSAAAQELLTAEVAEQLREERASGNSPWEMLPDTNSYLSSMAKFYGDTSAHPQTVDVAPAIEPVTLNASNGWSTTIDVSTHGHRVSGMIVSCGSSGAPYTVQIRGTARKDLVATYVPSPVQYDLENTTPIVSASLSADEAEKTVSAFTPDLSCRGGKLRVFVSSGTPPGDVTVTLTQNDPVVSLSAMAAASAPPIPPGFVVEVNGSPFVLTAPGGTPAYASAQAAGQTVKVYDYTGDPVATGTVPSNGKILGLVYVAPGAVVTLRFYVDGASTPALTTTAADWSTGQYVIPGLSAGQHTIRVSEQRAGHAEGPLGPPITVTV